MYAKQMRLFISIFLILFVACLSAESVYKTIDENGNVIFTDKPSEQAEEIKIKKLETIKNPNPAKYVPRRQQPTKTIDYYKNFVVTNPNGAIRSNDGNVSISLSLEPALKPDHKIIVLMDGKEIGSTTNISLQNVDRGTHSISASVVDADGNKLISTSGTFSLLRVSK